jgi:hypothetical protein
MSASSRRASLRSSISSLTDLLKEHHRAMNGAYASLHGGPRNYHARAGMPAPSYSSPHAAAHRQTHKPQNPSRRRTTITTCEIVQAAPETKVKAPGLARRISGAWGEVKERARRSVIAP